MNVLWSEEAGDADRPLIALIHGSMDRSAGMSKLSRRLDSQFRVLRYDRRGYGRSFPHPGPFMMAGQIDDLVGLLAGRRAVLVGHSYGGDVALATADRHPHLVAGVAVYETPLSWLPWWPNTTAGSIAVAEQRDTRAAAEQFMRRILGTRRWEGLPERVKETRRAEGVALVGELSDLRDNQPWTAEHITMPVITSYGSLASPHHRRGMTHAAALLNCPVVELPDCRHDAPLSHPDLFRTAIVGPLLQAVGMPYTDVTERATPQP